MLLPLLIILLPAFLIYSYLGTMTGFMGGAVIGVVVGVSGGLLEEWTIILAIIALASIIFIDQPDTVNVGVING